MEQSTRHVPARPVLAPGLQVRRRSRSELQIGLRPPRQVSLPDTAPVRRTLDALLRGEAPTRDPESLQVLAALAPVLADGAGLLAPDVAPGDVAAVALHDPSGYTRRLTARRAATVAVRDTLGVPSADVGPLLRAAGIRTVEEVGAAPSVVLVLSAGDVDRSELDPLVRDGVPHLLVRLIEGDAVVGPLVVPGRTACLRCLDAHQTLHDPAGAIDALRHAHPSDPRVDGVAAPADTALTTLAVAWAVRDLVSLVEGDLPSTWSATVRLTATLTPVTRTQWLRSPACGCGWLPDAQASRTMGA